jgi:enolase 1/2/3
VRYTFEQITLRGILDSTGKPTLEAEVSLRGGGRGWGSAPVAIAPGRRERVGSRRPKLGDARHEPELGKLLDRLARLAPEGPSELDGVLAEAIEDVGAHATLALSLAYLRAFCSRNDRSLVSYFAEHGAAWPRMPRLLVNLFSGGVHAQNGHMPFQQLMLIPRGADLGEDIDIACRVHAAIETILDDAGRSHRLSASSGFVVDQLTIFAAFELASASIARADVDPAKLAFGLDAAAEHLGAGAGRYRLEAGRTVSSRELLDLYDELCDRYPLVFLEDPFDPDDEAGWGEAMARLGGRTLIVGDDLFATTARRLRRDLAGGILLKMSQAGTVTAAIEAARAGLAASFTLCVSHRSGETEDCGMCDFAVGIGARYLKLGGPRRGDRIAKYNQLIRLDGTFGSGEHHP